MSLPAGVMDELEMLFQLIHDTSRLQFYLLVECAGPFNFWDRSFTINSNKSPTWCNSYSVYYSDVCLQLNMFRAFSRPSSRAQWLQWQPLVLPSYRGDSRAVFVVGSAVIELLMMDGKKPGTCRALNRRQDNKLKNCCFRFVIYLN
jgi:hypothetical protein